MIALSTALFSVAIGVTAAYVFSRMEFRGRQVLMITVLAVLMLPAVATIAPLFILLNKVQIGGFNLRQSLVGVAFAVISGLLPFAIWNLKGTSILSPRTWRKLRSWTARRATSRS